MMPAYPNFFGGYQAQPYYPTYQPAQPSSIIWVGGLQEAQVYPVAPNNAVALWDSSAPALYLKQADASGKPTMKIFDLVERQDAPPAEPAPAVEYVTKDALAQLSKAVESMRKDLKEIRAEMEGDK